MRILACAKLVLASLQAFIQNLALFFTAFYKVCDVCLEVVGLSCSKMVHLWQANFNFSRGWTSFHVVLNIYTAVAHWSLGNSVRKSDCFAARTGVLDWDLLCR